jgi:hypothetical protein
MSRPTLLTPEVQDRIVSAVRAGSYLDDAASMAGIGSSTLFLWLATGRQANEKRENGEVLTDRETLCMEFLEAVERARAEATLRNIAIIQKAAQDGTWQAAAWYLERTNPKKWGRHETYEVTGADGGPVQVEVSSKDTLRAKFETARKVALEKLGAPIEDAELADESREAM